MATAYEKANPILGNEIDYYSAKEKLGNDFKVLEEPIIIHWYLGGSDLWVFHVKYYNQQGVVFSHVHQFDGNKYTWCSLSADTVVKSEDESLVWNEEIADSKETDFYDGFVEFMDAVVANSTDEYIELDDLVL